MTIKNKYVFFLSISELSQDTAGEGKEGLDPLAQLERSKADLLSLLR